MHEIRIGGEAAEFLVMTVHGRRLPDSTEVAVHGSRVTNARHGTEW
jgi:hypothetical protein